MVIKISDILGLSPLNSTSGDVCSVPGILSNSSSGVVIFFFPRSDTPGCTSESKDFSDHYSNFRDLSIDVFGISCDSMTDQINFKKKYDIALDFLSDYDKTWAQIFGVWVEKSMFGKKYMGIERSTFFINGESVLEKEWRKVKVKNHVSDVLKYLTLRDS